jgi:hypothetical protein
MRSPGLEIERRAIAFVSLLNESAENRAALCTPYRAEPQSGRYAHAGSQDNQVGRSLAILMHLHSTDGHTPTLIKIPCVFPRIRES